MQLSGFIGVGENIHCTRIHKVGGKYVKESPDGTHAIHYESEGRPRQLRIPDSFVGTADWEAGKVKHCAVAMHQGLHGDDAGKAAGIDYLQSLAKAQAAAGATYLDVNVDEYSTDVSERVALVEWVVPLVQKSVEVPLSIDSSNTDILKAGIAACDPARGRPMLNSVSLERLDAIEVATQAKAVVIASAAGETGLPNTVEERLANLDPLVQRLTDAGLALGDIHIDPLVFPISVDGNNGKSFLAAVSAIRERYGAEIHIVAGLSNVSFGMPNRKLINQTFSYLAVEAGADGGIVDPLQVNVETLNSLDTDSEPFRIAKALLLGEDSFGMNYITAAREGRI